MSMVQENETTLSGRRNKNKPPNTKDQQIAELKEQLAKSLETIQRQQKELERLQTKLEELERAGKCQAAPFARRKWVEKPKRPGRKAWQRLARY